MEVGSVRPFVYRIFLGEMTFIDPCIKRCTHFILGSDPRIDRMCAETELHSVLRNDARDDRGHPTLNENRCEVSESTRDMLILHDVDADRLRATGMHLLYATVNANCVCGLGNFNMAEMDVDSFIRHRDVVAVVSGNGLKHIHAYRRSYYCIDC